MVSISTITGTVAFFREGLAGSEKNVSLTKVALSVEVKRCSRDPGDAISSRRGMILVMMRLVQLLLGVARLW